MGLPKYCAVSILSPAPPPAKSSCPVSPSYAYRRSVPVAHTMKSVPVLVTMGDARSLSLEHHTGTMVGGDVAVIFTVTRFPLALLGQSTPVPAFATLKVTNVPAGDV